MGNAEMSIWKLGNNDFVNYLYANLCAMIFV